MPESEHQKIRKELEPLGEPAPVGPYVELQVTTNFSFLRGGSHPHELVKQAQHMGCKAVAITDINTLAGIVRGYTEAKEISMPYIVGCHVQTKSDSDEIPLSLLMYPTDRAAYGRLCRMLTKGKLRAKKANATSRSTTCSNTPKETWPSPSRPPS